jgi:hypothetical protein
MPVVQESVWPFCPPLWRLDGGRGVEIVVRDEGN